MGDKAISKTFHVILTISYHIPDCPCNSYNIWMTRLSQTVQAIFTISWWQFARMTWWVVRLTAQMDGWHNLRIEWLSKRENYLLQNRQSNISFTQNNISRPPNKRSEMIFSPNIHIYTETLLRFSVEQNLSHTKKASKFKYTR